MVLGRTRTAGFAVLTVLVTATALVTPMVIGDNADAAGDSYKVQSWVDPDGGHHRVRWNPCQKITYAVNPQLAGHSSAARSSAITDVKRAFHRASKRAGLSFKYTGRTNELPQNTSGKSWSERQHSAEIVVAWVDQSRPKYRSNLLTRSGSGYASGVGGWMLRGWTDNSGRWRAAVGRGFVVLNAAHNPRYERGFGSGVTRGALLLHEIGHSLGLGHVGTTREIMYPTMLSRQHSSYKSGDERGLTKVGRRQGCIKGADSIWPQI